MGGKKKVNTGCEAMAVQFIWNRAKKPARLNPLESRKSSRSRIRGGEGRIRGAGGVSAWIGNRERRNRGTRREAVRTGRSS